MAPGLIMRVCLYLTLFLAFCSLPGCARTNARQMQSASPGDYYVVTAAAAFFFIYGPQQASGPDHVLPRGTLVSVHKIALGYARVSLTSGEQGYVAREDIKPAPPSLLPTPTPSPTATPVLKYPEPKLPSVDATPSVEPSAIPAPSASP